MEGGQVTLAKIIALNKKCDGHRTMIVNNEAKIVNNDDNVMQLDKKKSRKNGGVCMRKSSVLGALQRDRLKKRIF